jgi:hypothetical protein
LTWKPKHFERSPDDIEGERGRRGRVSRDFLAFNVTVILPANDVGCFGRVTLLSRELSRLAWIALSFNIIDAGKCSVCFVDLALLGIFFFA